MAGKSNQQELELISNLDIMLSMDSGNAHCGYARYKCHFKGYVPYAGFLPFNKGTKRFSF
jgi:hypothetical protein